MGKQGKKVKAQPCHIFALQEEGKMLLCQNESSFDDAKVEREFNSTPSRVCPHCLDLLLRQTNHLSSQLKESRSELRDSLRRASRARLRRSPGG